MVQSELRVARNLFSRENGVVELGLESRISSDLPDGVVCFLYFASLVCDEPEEVAIRVGTVTVVV